VAFGFLEVFLARSHKSLLILIVLILAACKATPPARVAKVTPPTMPVLPQHVDPVPAGIPAELPAVNFNDPVDLAILQAQLRFEKGEDLYRQGFLKRAKEEFDSAVDVILETSGSYPKEPRLQRQLMEMVARVNAMELAALREGDGFTDQSDQPAAIDDLESVETFPALIDPKLKKTVEDEVK
jgi:hypothetical protein